MSYNRAHVCVYIICVSYNVKNIFACIYACLCNVTILVKVELEVIIYSAAKTCTMLDSFLYPQSCKLYSVLLVMHA